MMKKILSMIMILLLSITLCSCQKDEYNGNDLFDYKNGTFEINMYDSSDLIETITIKYIDDKINKVEYLINEADEEILEIDREQLEKLHPSKIVNSELALYAVFDSEEVNDVFLGLKKEYVYDYVATLMESSPEYIFTYTYNPEE